MLGTRGVKKERRSRSRSREVNGSRRSQTKTAVKDKTVQKGPMDRFVEPVLLEKPSYRDHGGSPYGVLEHMQTLGEAPNTRVRNRVKPEGGRKSLLGKGGGGVGLDSQDTPEGTPVPVAAELDTPSQPRIVVDDERDRDYVPKGAGIKKEHAGRGRDVNRTRVTPEAEETPTGVSTIGRSVSATQHEAKKLYDVVEVAKERARKVGKPELADAVDEIYAQSLNNVRLTELLQIVVSQDATEAQTKEFQKYVHAAKKKLKAAKKMANAAGGGTKSPHSLALRSPSKFTSASDSAIPSTEKSEPPKLKITPKVETLSKNPDRRRSAHGNTNGNSNSTSTKMSATPKLKRSGTVESDSSLTSMTSNEDDMAVDEPQPVKNAATSGRSSKVNGVKGKDHAAERGHLSAPARTLKRSSTDAELHDEERDRALATKKQKLRQGVTRDDAYEESSMRKTLNVPTPRVREQRGNAFTIKPSLPRAPNGAHAAGLQAGRRASTDQDSPRSEMSPAQSRRSTPHVYKGPAKTLGKRAKTKQSPEKKKQLTGYGGMSGVGGAGRESPIGDDDNEELSENNDFCSACGGSGFLLCCDGCDRSFHFSCLDPPLNEDASELNEPWYCFVCVAKRPLAAERLGKPPRGLFAPLLNSLRKRNPSNFQLPQDIRDFFEGVATDKNGSFLEAVNTRTRNRPGYDELPDYTRIKDGKGNTVLCFSCGKTSQGSRAIIPCDYCGENWHLDCLDPPLANPPARNLEGKKVSDWMCPLHADHELRKVETKLLNRGRRARKIHIRKPRNAKVVETQLTRGCRNNGVIEVMHDASDSSDSEFYDEETQDESVVYRLPASGIKLDFIDRIKNNRVQELRNEQAFKKAGVTAPAAPNALNRANFARRSFRDKQMALNLIQLAGPHEHLDLGGGQLENLVGTLIAEAPHELVEEMSEAENAEKARSTSSAIPPSPPSSDQAEHLSPEQRKQLEILREIIRQKLDNNSTG